MRDKVIFSVLAVLFWIISCLTIGMTSNYFIEHQIQQEKTRIIKELDIVRFNLEASIFMDTYLADSLATVVSLNPKFALDKWNEIAGKLLKKARYVRNVGLAPNNIISNIYPLEGNEAAIGFNYASRPEQLKTVLFAKQQKSVFIAGPVNLIQGGTGLIARYPIFYNTPTSDNEYYWGGVSVVMDFDRLLFETGITNFNDAEIALMKINNIDGSRQVFYGDEKLFKNPDLEYPIQLPNGTWRLAANFIYSNMSQVNFMNNVFVSASLLVSLILFGLLVLLFRNYKHKEMLTLRDELTHLPNRRYVMSKLNELAAEKESQFTLLNIDVNGFKYINDTLGHDAGDKFLKHIAKILTNETKTHGTVARYGGDEFLIILTNIDIPAHIEIFISQIRRAIKTNPFHWEEQILIPSLSIGFAIFKEEIQSVEQLLSCADASMYTQKQRSRRKTDSVL
ncbi:sensor domain-containing diguanylate cyclase [Psychromonas sp.]|nr:sensor domain-containing diguanylate cyclase [Psychromonas sp.]